MTHTNVKGGDLSSSVPNICSPMLSREEKQIQLQKYYNAWGNYVKAKCAKCGKEGRRVGRNFRHCKTKKGWIELEMKANNGDIDLQKDFRNYPREGTQEYKESLMEHQPNLWYQRSAKFPGGILW